MFVISKTADGWTVVDSRTGERAACEATLLSAVAIKAHLESGATADPTEHTLVDELCACGHYRESCLDCAA